MTERGYLIITIREAAVKITKIDHIHVYVDNIKLAERWYQEVLGFSRDDSLYFWFEQGGPLVIRNHCASLSLFPRKNQHPGHTVAFVVEAAEFLSFVPALNAKNIPFTVCDHDVSLSVYFNDLSDNKIELTSCEYLQAKQLLSRVHTCFGISWQRFWQRVSKRYCSFCIQHTWISQANGDSYLG